MNWRSPAVLMTIIGGTATLVLAVTVLMALLLTGGLMAVANNVSLIGALIVLGGAFTAQMVNIALRQRQSLQGGPTEQGTEQRIARLTKALLNPRM